MKTVSIIEVEYLAHSLAKKLMTWNEPIPDFETRYPNILESCLLTPFQTFDKKSLYKEFTKKAAALFYFLIKNHPFQNGNKRTAVTTLFVFLYKNKKWLRLDNQELYNFAVWVAKSPAKLKDEVIGAIFKFLKTHLVEI